MEKYEEGWTAVESKKTKKQYKKEDSRNINKDITAEENNKWQEQHLRKAELVNDTVIARGA